MAVSCTAEKAEKSSIIKPGYFAAVLVILLTVVSCILIGFSSSGSFIPATGSDTEADFHIPSASGMNSALAVSENLTLSVTDFSIDGNTVTLSICGENSGKTPYELAGSRFELNFQDKNNADIRGYASPENDWSWNIPPEGNGKTTQSFVIPTEGEAAYTLVFYSEERRIAGQFYLVSGETINN